MNSHIVPRKIYVLIWASLMLLLLLTWAVAQFNLGPFNAVAALTIAVTKMLLVILYFMHVRYSERRIWIFVAAGFIWLLIMIDLTLGDYLTRAAGPVP
jgi:cytochrome c oxidase subunit IV